MFVLIKDRPNKSNNDGNRKLGQLLTNHQLLGQQSMESNGLIMLVNKRILIRANVKISLSEKFLICFSILMMTLINLTLGSCIYDAKFILICLEI